MTIIEVQHMSFSYGSQQVLKDLSFQIEAGEIVGLIGVNGAGKSTLLNILLGRLAATGQVKVFDGIPGNAQARAQIGSMLQGDMVLRGVTVKELLALTAANATQPANVSDILHTLQLTALAPRLLTQLSGGQLRRVTYAVALMGTPSLLFLDEPTVGMDAAARQSFWQTIQHLRDRGKTIIITSHKLEEIQQVADRLLILQHGHFVFQGSFAALQAGHRETRFACRTRLTLERFRQLPGVTAAACQNGRVTFRSMAESLTLQGLVPLLPALQDLTIAQRSLEEIFIDLTEEAQADETVTN